MHAFNSGGLTYNAIRDLFVVAGWGHGQAVTLGNVLEMTVENVRAINGFHGVGSFSVGANYNIYVRNCYLQGSDAAYYGYMQLISGRDVYCLNSAKATFRLVGCNSAWRDVFVAFAAGNSECFFKFHSYESGGSHSVYNFQADFEGYSLSLAAFYCEAHGLAPATALALKDVQLGTVGANTALVMLKDMGLDGAEYHKCWLSVENLQAYTNSYIAAVDVDGPLWGGEVKGVALNGPQFKHRAKWGTTTRVLVRDTKYVGPPRQFLWYSGARPRSAIPGGRPVRRVAVHGDGHLRDLDPAQVGRRQSAPTHDEWAGRLRREPGVYSRKHSLKRVRTMAGFFTDYSNNKVLDLFFGSATITPPATLYFGLSQTPSNKSGTCQEPSGGGYASAALTNSLANFAAATGGTKSNSTTITFPAPTAAWGTILSLFVADSAAGGNVLAMADLTTPKTIAGSGTPPALAVGALYLSHT